jgi:chromosome segregation ATPase
VLEIREGVKSEPSTNRQEKSRHRHGKTPSGQKPHKENLREKKSGPLNSAGENGSVKIGEQPTASPVPAHTHSDVNCTEQLWRAREEIARLESEKSDLETKLIHASTDREQECERLRLEIVDLKRLCEAQERPKGLDELEAKLVATKNDLANQTKRVKELLSREREFQERIDNAEHNVDVLQEQLSERDKTKKDLTEVVKRMKRYAIKKRKALESMREQVTNGMSTLQNLIKVQCQRLSEAEKKLEIVVTRVSETVIKCSELHELKEKKMHEMKMENDGLKRQIDEMVLDFEEHLRGFELRICEIYQGMGES